MAEQARPRRLCPFCKRLVERWQHHVDLVCRSRNAKAVPEWISVRCKCGERIRIHVERIDPEFAVSRVSRPEHRGTGGVGYADEVAQPRMARVRGIPNARKEALRPRDDEMSAAYTACWTGRQSACMMC